MTMLQTLLNIYITLGQYKL